MQRIPLTQGKFALVDKSDFEYLAQWKWRIARKRKGSNEFYAARSDWNKGHQRNIWMHRVITKCPTGMVVDHINGDGLDNRRRNLRVCTNSQNQWNRRISKRNKTGEKGVSVDPKGSNKKWHASISVSGKSISLGYFTTKTEAAKAYKLNVVRYRGK